VIFHVMTFLCRAYSDTKYSGARRTWWSEKYRTSIKDKIRIVLLFKMLITDNAYVAWLCFCCALCTVSVPSSVTFKWLVTLIMYAGLSVVERICQLRRVMRSLALPFWRIVLPRWPATHSSNYPSISLPPPTTARPSALGWWRLVSGNWIVSSRIEDN
jgi:hypothetical protein